MNKLTKYVCSTPNCGLEYSEFAFKKLKGGLCKLCKGVVVQIEPNSLEGAMETLSEPTTFSLGDVPPKVTQATMFEDQSSPDTSSSVENTDQSTSNQGLEVLSEDIYQNPIPNENLPEANTFIQNEDSNFEEEILQTETPPVFDIPQEGETFPSIISSNETQLAELIIPANNKINSDAVVQLISTFPDQISFEFFGANNNRKMLLRGDAADLRYVINKINSLYPSAIVQLLPEEADPFDNGTENYHRFDYSIHLTKSDMFPIKTFLDYEKGDPVRNILDSLLSLKPNEKIWIQILSMNKGKPKWLPEVQNQIKLEENRGFMTQPGGEFGTRVPTYEITKGNIRILFSIFYWMIGLTLSLLFFYRGGVIGGAAFILMALVLYSLVMYLLRGSNKTEWQTTDIELLKEKVSQHSTYHDIVIRACVWTDTQQAKEKLQKRIQNVFEQYTKSGGNQFVVEEFPQPIDSLLEAMEFERKKNTNAWLTSNEVAGFWHLPYVEEGSPLSFMKTSLIEKRYPDEADVQGVYPIGYYDRSDGSVGEVRIPKTALESHMFFLGKTGTGKSTAMENIAMANILENDCAVVVVDPHGDMAKRMESILPMEHIDRLMILDMSDQDYILPFNPLDGRHTKMGMKQTVDYMVDVCEAAWPDSWGSRMVIPFRKAIQYIYLLNFLQPRNYAYGMDIMTHFLTCDKDTRRNYFKLNDMDEKLKTHREFVKLLGYFYMTFNTYSPNFREQIISPVLSKSVRFEEEPLGSLFSPKKSYLNLQQVIKEKKILVVNTAQPLLGADTSGLIGSLLINFIIKEINRQGNESNDDRSPIVLLVDEFQTFPGVNWSSALQEIRKYGGRTILGTQTIGALKETSDHLIDKILGSTYSAFVFAVNGTDANYLANNEFSTKRGGPSPETLINLQKYTCYVKYQTESGFYSTPFFMQTKAPLKSNPEVQKQATFLKHKYSLPKAQAEENIMENPFKNQISLLTSTGAKPAKQNQKTESSASTSYQNPTVLKVLQEAIPSTEEEMEFPPTLSYEEILQRKDNLIPNQDEAAEISDLLLNNTIEKLAEQNSGTMNFDIGSIPNSSYQFKKDATLKSEEEIEAERQQEQNSILDFFEEQSIKLSNQEDIQPLINITSEDGFEDADGNFIKFDDIDLPFDILDEE